LDMAVRTVKKFPDPVLRRKAENIQDIDEGVLSLIEDMFETMEEEIGVGLAAPQIGISKRVIVVSVDEKGFERFALINPVIIQSSEELMASEEGCLSVPGINADVTRPRKVVVQGTTRNGRAVEITASGMLARVLQHEIDHLNGVLFIDRLDEKDKKKVQRELDDMKRQFAATTR
jgi:peptide deformylase